MKLSGSSRDLEIALFQEHRFDGQSWECSMRVCGFSALLWGQVQGFLRPCGGCPGLVSFLKGGRAEIQSSNLPPLSLLRTTAWTRTGTTKPTGRAGRNVLFSVQILSGSFSLPGLCMFGETQVMCLEEQVSKCEGILRPQPAPPPLPG